eukprot:GGOE01004254.1.p1 GENE.GGOE01004254.1~~GGOE01004254.1.p1  ORF type:complete len:626 (-),score=213.28 GGOE01004254.1:288-2165(-)
MDPWRRVSNQRSQPSSSSGTLLNELSSIQEELARLRKTESKAEPQSAFPAPHRSLAPEPPARRGVSGAKFSGFDDDGGHRAGQRPKTPERRASLGGRSSSSLRDEIERMKAKVQEEMRSLNGDEGTGGECADVQEQRRQAREQGSSSGTRSKVDVDVELSQLDRKRAGLEAERQLFERQQMEHRTVMLQAKGDLQAEEQRLEKERQELLAERQELRERWAALERERLNAASSSVEIRAPSKEKATEAADMLERVQRLLEEEKRGIARDREELEQLRGEVQRERQELNDSKRAQQRQKETSHNSAFAWDVVQMGEMQLQLAMEQAQLDLDKSKLVEAQIRLNGEKARVAEELSELCDSRAILNTRLSEMDRGYAALQKHQADLQRAQEAAEAEWKEVQRARDQVKELLADASKRLIPVLETLEQMRREDAAHGSRGTAGQMRGADNNYSSEHSSDRSRPQYHSGSKPRTDTACEYDPDGRRRSALEMYRQRTMDLQPTAPPGHGPKTSNWDDFRQQPILLGHLSLAKYEFRQIDVHRSGRVSGKALAQWILEYDPSSMRNLIPGQLKLMYQAVDNTNVGSIDFWGFLAIQLFVLLDLSNFNMFEWLVFVNTVNHPKHEARAIRDSW